ncbi:hypothetical protein BDV18DRAFT_132994 [Aspergillus unguis]
MAGRFSGLSWFLAYVSILVLVLLLLLLVLIILCLCSVLSVVRASASRPVLRTLCGRGRDPHSIRSTE